MTFILYPKTISDQVLAGSPHALDAMINVASRRGFNERVCNSIDEFHRVVTMSGKRPDVLTSQQITDLTTYFGVNFPIVALTYIGFREQNRGMQAKELPFSLVKNIITFGGNVVAYPAWVELTSAQYNGNVPSFVPFYNYVDENGDTITRTWSEWCGGNAPLYGTKYYVELMFNSYRLLGDEIKTIDNNVSYTVKDINQYLAIVEANTPE